MSVTEFKRRNKKTYFFLGTVSVLVPALVVVCFLFWKLDAYSQRNDVLENELNQKMKKTTYVLKMDVSAGEKLEKHMLQKVTMTGEDNTNMQSVSEKELIGKFVKCNFSKGSVLNKQSVYEEEEFKDDMRIQKFDFIEINSMIQKNSYVDIRIVYPSGEDYIVANHKKVMDIQTEQNSEAITPVNTKVFLKVTEEEILRLASAYVDTICYSGTRIYAISYIDRFQEAGTVNYPVNLQVFELLSWNPNVMNYTASEEEQERRSILEKHLSGYVTETIQTITEQVLTDNRNFFDTESFLYE